MRNWVCRILGLVIWLGLSISSPAQTFSGFTSDGAPIGPPPASGVQDNAGVFRRNPALMSKITKELRDLKEQHDFQIYLVLESVLVNGSVQQMAAELQQAWVPKGDGIVLVLEVDSRSLGVGEGIGPDLEKKPEEGQVPAYATTGILTRVSDRVDRTAPPDVFLDAMISSLTADYTAYFKLREAPIPEGRNVRLGLLVMGGASALALVGLVAAWMLKRSSRGSSGKFYFPEVDASERLGAPYGGGEVSFRRFGRDAGGRS